MQGQLRPCFEPFGALGEPFLYYMEKTYNGKCAVLGSIAGELEFGGIFDNETAAMQFIADRMADQYADYFECDEHDGMTLEEYIDSFFTNKSEGNIINEWIDVDPDGAEYDNKWQIAKI